MKNNYTLFTTSSCPKCPEAMNWANENLEVFDIVIADKDKGSMQLARDLNILEVPMFVNSDTLEKFTLDEMKKKWQNGKTY